MGSRHSAGLRDGHRTTSERADQQAHDGFAGFSAHHLFDRLFRHEFQLDDRHSWQSGSVLLFGCFVTHGVCIGYPCLVQATRITLVEAKGCPKATSKPILTAGSRGGCLHTVERGTGQRRRLPIVEGRRCPHSFPDARHVRTKNAKKCAQARSRPAQMIRATPSTNRSPPNINRTANGVAGNNTVDTTSSKPISKLTTAGMNDPTPPPESPPIICNTPMKKPSTAR